MHSIVGLFVTLVGSVVMLVAFVFYLFTLQRALAGVSEANRRMTPGLVWLNVVPLFNLGWHLYTVIKLAESLRAEYGQRGLAASGSFGYELGIAASVLFVLFQLLFFVPLLGLLVWTAWLVCWIVYWVQIDGYARRLAAAR
jgi:hypothetical protein